MKSKKLSKKKSKSRGKTQHKKTFVSFIITTWIMITLTGVSLFWFGKIESSNLQKGIYVVSKVLIYCLEIITETEID